MLYVSYVNEIPLCVNFVYVLLHNYSIGFDQTSVK